MSMHDMLILDIATRQTLRRVIVLRSQLLNIVVNKRGRKENYLNEQLLKKYNPMTETTYYTLLSVKEPRHGYAIMQFVSGLTVGRIQLGTGTLYTMLGRLVEDGLIEILSQDDNGKKIYQITELGKLFIGMEIERLKHQLENGVQIFGNGEADL